MTKHTPEQVVEDLVKALEFIVGVCPPGKKGGNLDNAIQEARAAIANAVKDSAKETQL